MNEYRTMQQRTEARPEVVNAFMRGVYGWMTGGLALTAGIALYVASNPSLVQAIFSNTMIVILLIIAQFGLVITLSAAIRKLSPGTAGGLFLLYSALTGVTFSVIFLAYTQADIFKAFLTAGGMFGAMSIYGMTTKKDLTSWGSFLFMGLIGLVIAMVVNIFLASAMMDFVISIIGVIIFTGLTAYDTQRLKDMGDVAPGRDGAAVKRATILGALTLYLDFINLFLMLLRLFGGGRQ